MDNVNVSLGVAAEVGMDAALVFGVIRSLAEINSTRKVEISYNQLHDIIKCFTPRKIKETILLLEKFDCKKHLEGQNNVIDRKAGSI